MILKKVQKCCRNLAVRGLSTRILKTCINVQFCQVGKFQYAKKNFVGRVLVYPSVPVISYYLINHVRNNAYSVFLLQTYCFKSTGRTRV